MGVQHARTGTCAHACLNTRVNCCATYRQGTALFLFNFSARVLYGVYLGHEVGMDLDLDAWQGRFPAQVRRPSSLASLALSRRSRGLPHRLSPLVHDARDCV